MCVVILKGYYEGDDGVHLYFIMCMCVGILEGCFENEIFYLILVSSRGFN